MKQFCIKSIVFFLVVFSFLFFVGCKKEQNINSIYLSVTVDSKSEIFLNFQTELLSKLENFIINDINFNKNGVESVCVFVMNRFKLDNLKWSVFCSSNSVIITIGENESFKKEKTIFVPQYI